MVSSSHCVAKGVIAPPDAFHVCYCHTPMRYAWDQEHAYFPKRTGIKARLRSLTLSALRSWDVSSAARVNHFVANSRFVARRIQSYYGRPAEVVHPPVDVEFFTPGPDAPGRHGARPREYCLVVSALAPYKKVEVAMAACEKLGLELRIVGDGPERERLEGMAGPRAHFLGNVDPEELRDLYRGARLFLQPGSRTSASPPSRRSPAARRWSPWPAAASSTWWRTAGTECSTRTGRARPPSATPLTKPAGSDSMLWTCAIGRSHSLSRDLPIACELFYLVGFRVEGASPLIQERHRKTAGLYFFTDLAATLAAFLGAWLLRFEVEVIPVTKNVPEFGPYLRLVPFVLVLWPVVFYFHGLYQSRRGRSRVDEVLTIVLAVLLATVLLSVVIAWYRPPRGARQP